jgi:hypothetical protein
MDNDHDPDSDATLLASKWHSLVNDATEKQLLQSIFLFRDLSRAFYSVPVYNSDQTVLFTAGRITAIRAPIRDSEDQAIIECGVEIDKEWDVEGVTYSKDNVARALDLALQLVSQKCLPFYPPRRGECLRRERSASWEMSALMSVLPEDIQRALDVLWKALERIMFQILDAGLATASVQTLTQRAMVERECTFVGSARSNYFRVKDLPAFSSWASSRDLEVWDNHDDPSLHCIVPAGLLRESHGYPSDAGIWPLATLQGGEVKKVNIPTELAQHLADGWVAILSEMGLMGQDVMLADSIAINSDGEIVTISFDDLFEKAKRLGEVLGTV